MKVPQIHQLVMPEKSKLMEKEVVTLLKSANRFNINQISVKSKKTARQNSDQEAKNNAT